MNMFNKNSKFTFVHHVCAKQVKSNTKMYSDNKTRSCINKTTDCCVAINSNIIQESNNFAVNKHMTSVRNSPDKCLIIGIRIKERYKAFKLMFGIRNRMIKNK